jgi:hypothetical protein
LRPGFQVDAAIGSLAKFALHAVLYAVANRADRTMLKYRNPLALSYFFTFCGILKMFRLVNEHPRAVACETVRPNSERPNYHFVAPLRRHLEVSHRRISDCAYTYQSAVGIRDLMTRPKFPDLQISQSRSRGIDGRASDSTAL